MIVFKTINPLETVYFLIPMSQIFWDIGIIKNIKKYRNVKICPVIMKGSSTACLPIHVSIMKIVISDQNKNCDIG